MKLEKARITNFRCIDDSEDFRIGQVTCLVGKNESGKTAILHALAKLNSVDPSLAKFDKERDYPRKILTDYDEETKVLDTTWTLDPEDINAVEDVIGKGALKSQSVTIERDYTNSDAWNVEIDEQKAIGWLLSEAGCTATEKQKFENCNTVAELLTKAESLKAGSPRIAALIERIEKWRDNDPESAAIDVLDERTP